MKQASLGDQAHRITHLMGEQNYTTIYFVDAPSLLISKTLSYCIDQLPSFIRLHRKCAVNPAFILEVRPLAEKPVVIVGTAHLPISRRRLGDAIKRIRIAKKMPQRLPGL